MTWGYALLLALLLPVGVALAVLAVGRVALSGARRCTGTVTAVQIRRGMTGSPPYVPLFYRTTTIRYHDHTGQEHTFRYQGPLRPAVGETLTVAHRRHRPQRPQVVADPPGGPVSQN